MFSLESTSQCPCTSRAWAVHPSCRVAACPAVLFKLPARAAAFILSFLSVIFCRGISFYLSAANGQNSDEGACGSSSTYCATSALQLQLPAAGELHPSCLASCACLFLSDETCWLLPTAVPEGSMRKDGLLPRDLVSFFEALFPLLST